MPSVLHICKSRVDFPIPGSPDRSTTEPETIPPPKTRSNSPMPVFIRSFSEKLISRIRRARGDSVIAPSSLRGFFDFAAAGAGDSSVCSEKLFHSPHCGHLPYHFALIYPQFSHKYSVFIYPPSDIGICCKRSKKRPIPGNPLRKAARLRAGLK